MQIEHQGNLAVQSRVRLQRIGERLKTVGTQSQGTRMYWHQWNNSLLMTLNDHLVQTGF